MKKPNNESGMSILLEFILVLAAFWVLWYFSGGPSRYSSNTSPFLNVGPSFNTIDNHNEVGH